MGAEAEAAIVSEKLQLQVRKPQQEGEVAVANRSCHHRPAVPVPLARLVAALAEDAEPAEAEMA